MTPRVGLNCRCRIHRLGCCHRAPAPFLVCASHSPPPPRCALCFASKTLFFGLIAPPLFRLDDPPPLHPRRAPQPINNSVSNPLSPPRPPSYPLPCAPSPLPPPLAMQQPALIAPSERPSLLLPFCAGGRGPPLYARLPLGPPSLCWIIGGSPSSSPTLAPSRFGASTLPLRRRWRAPRPAAADLSAFPPPRRGLSTLTDASKNRRLLVAFPHMHSEIKPAAPLARPRRAQNRRGAPRRGPHTHT